jgi:hypothetical protein
METYWRITPTPFVEDGVRKIAEREGRTLSNCLHKLLTEALMQRKRQHRKLEEMKKLAAKAAEQEALVNVIRGANP